MTDTFKLLPHRPHWARDLHGETEVFTVQEVEAATADLRAENERLRKLMGDAEDVMVRQRDARKQLEARVAELEKALRWYADEARAIAANMQATPPKPEACMASLTVLSLDAGERAALAAGKESHEQG